MIENAGGHRPASDSSGAGDERGSLLGVLSYRGLKPVYFGTLVVTGGQWIQNVVLAAYAYDRSGSALVVGLIVFAQLGPMLFFGPFAGAIADLVDRRMLLRIAVSAQSVGAAMVAVASTFESSSLWLLVAPIVFCGLAQTLFLSSYSSLMPILVPHSALRRVLSLNAAILSSARIVGPGLGALLYAGYGQVVPLGAVAVLYASVVIATLAIPRPAARPQRPSVSLATIFGGFTVARSDSEIRRILLTVSLFSVACLPFLNQMPAVAESTLGVRTTDLTYSLLFVAIGVGSIVGGVVLGTALVDTDMARLSRRLMYLFAVLVIALAVNRSVPVGIALLVALGFTYFGVITTLITRLQLHLDEAVRGRVMSLWFMGFGGLQPVGAALAGPVIDATAVWVVLVVAAVAAVPLGVYVGREPALA